MRARTSGFALLEALVALVLLASTGVALIQWLQQGSQSLVRLERIERDLADREWALAMLQTRRLLDEPDGRLEQGGLQMRWTTRHATEPRPNGTPGGVAGPWVLSLVDLQVELQRSGQSTQRFDVRLLGQKRTELADSAPPM